ncbi:MAG: hypothetical protein CMK59_12150 [Proteobacteria bacterium]|nr:hypothetical protein [Pseudomonadota bacterium]
MRRLFKNKSFAQNDGFSEAALAPMVDLFTLLVIAVLRASSPEPALQLNDPTLELPISTSETPRSEGAVIEVGKQGIYLNGQRTTSTDYWLDQDEMLIRELYQSLLHLSETKAELRIHGDLPWKIVEQCLTTTQQAGYGDISIVALSSSSL